FQMVDINESCFVADQLAASQAYVTFMAVKAFLCYLALLLLVWHVKRNGVRWLVHTNTKIVFSSYLVCNFVASAAFGIIYTVDVYRLWLGGPCPLLHYRVVFVLRGVGIIALMSEILCGLVLSLERLYSSCRPVHFEKAASVGLSVVAVVVSLVTSTGVMVVFLVPLSNFSALVPTTNLKTPETAEGYKMMIYFMIGMELASILTFHIGWLVNYCSKPDPDASSSIALLYQIKENAEIISTMLPIEYIHSFFMCAITFGMALYPVIVQSKSPLNMQIFLEVLSMPAHFTLFLVAILEYKLARRRRRLRHCVLSDETSHYFKQLRK
ncbi:hypothetical protein PFISCL1PPCAC_21389, partial [Pristionchus fissidentatus]